MPDFEAPADAGRDNTYNVTVTADDSSDRTAVLNVVVMVTNAEEDGTVVLSTLVPKVGVELTATLTGDEDGATSGVTWKWERADDAAFDTNVTEIEGATSAAYTPVHDDMGKYLRATVMYTDPEGEDSASVISANDVVGSNRAPAFLDTESTTEVDESMNRELEQPEGAFPAAETIGDEVAAVDPDTGESAQLTYELSGDAAPFEINRSDGQISVSAGETLDHETKDSYVVMVRATDPAGLSDTVTVTIKITNVQEDPVISIGGLVVRGPGRVEYAEDRTDAVATYTVSGPDAASATWSLEGADAGDFRISRAGVLTFRTSPDYEDSADDNVYMVTVKADDGTYTDTHDVTITVTGMDENVVQPAQTLLERYDTDKSNGIDQDEVIKAINDYLFGEGDDAISQDQVIDVINLYLFGS